MITPNKKPIVGAGASTTTTSMAMLSIIASAPDFRGGENPVLLCSQAFTLPFFKGAAKSEHRGTPGNAKDILGRESGVRCKVLLNRSKSAPSPISTGLLATDRPGPPFSAETWRKTPAQPLLCSSLELQLPKASAVYPGAIWRRSRAPLLRPRIPAGDHELAPHPERLPNEFPVGHKHIQTEKNNETTERT